MPEEGLHRRTHPLPDMRRPPALHPVHDRDDPAGPPRRARTALARLPPGRDHARPVRPGRHPRQVPQRRRWSAKARARRSDLRRRFLLFVLPRFEVGYHDGTAPRTAFLVGNPPNRRVRDVDEQRLPVRLLRLRQLLSRLLSRLRGKRSTPGQPRLTPRIALTAAALTLLSVGLVLLVIFFSGR
jgi:hypothetical protein